MKVYTITDLQDRLDKDFAWRLKEIADLKSAVRTTTDLRQKTLIRAGVPLLYAHWEGFVKNAAEIYIAYVSCRRLRFDELKSNFVFLGAKRHIQNMALSKKAEVSIAVVDFFRNKMNERAEILISNSIDTESNLSSVVFKNIVLTLGIDYTKYESRANFIDISLLKVRNCIAHGAYLQIGGEDYRVLADEVIMLLRWIKNDLENSASADGFKVKV